VHTEGTRCPTAIAIVFVQSDQDETFLKFLDCFMAQNAAVNHLPDQILELGLQLHVRTIATLAWSLCSCMMAYSSSEEDAFYVRRDQRPTGFPTVQRPKSVQWGAS
jgi:hypothetical protein